MDSPLLDQHARINAVRVDGAKNTRRSFLASLVYPHLPQSPHSSFESVLRATRDIGHYLVQSDLFQSVHARLEPSADPAAKPGDVDVIFSTRERPRFFLKTSTEVGNSEGTAVRITHLIPRTHTVSVSLFCFVFLLSQSATSRIRNVFGGGETFEANVSFGTKTRRSFNATFTAPVTRTLDTHGELSVFALDRDNTSYMSATETLRGARAVIRVRRVRACQPHRLTRERAALSEVQSAHAQDNTNLATKRRCAISAALNLPPLSGLHRTPLLSLFLLILTSTRTHARFFHPQRAHSCRDIHKVVALPQMDPRHPRPPDPRHPRRTRATATRTRRARWRRRILQSRRISARIARAPPGSR
jgi:hypothetical protein